MGGRVLIVDRDPSRRAALRVALGAEAGDLRGLDDPAGLPDRLLAERPDLVVLDLDPEEASLDALRRLRAGSDTPLPVLALIPADRPDLRLAALRAGAEEAVLRSVAPRILQARVRSLLRNREAALDAPPEEAVGVPARLSLAGLAEEPAAFLGPAGSPSPRVRVAILAALAGPGPSPAEGLARLLGAEQVPLPALAESGDRRPDLVVIDALGTTGDLSQGTGILATLAELRGRPATRDAATLVLLPACATQTAALALDLGAGDVAAGPSGPEEVALRARTLLGQKAAADRLRDERRFRLRVALTDPLTGLHNLHHARPELRRMADAAHRTGRDLAVMMLDIDHFKSINDRYGHAAGNHVLIEVARRLRSGLRPGDLLARIGGEEFLAALPDAPLPEARVVAERLRRAVAEQPITLDPGCAAPAVRIPPQSFAGPIADEPEWPSSTPLRVRVTLSIGVAAASASDLAQGLTTEDLQARADRALYAAKAAGRNAVAAAPGIGIDSWPGALASS